MNRGNVGILTGGGDAPGLNQAIYVLTRQLVSKGYGVFGIRRGWLGLLVPESFDDSIMELTPDKIRTIPRTGGTYLHTSRTNPLNVRDEDIDPRRFKHITGFRGISDSLQKYVSNATVTRNNKKVGPDLTDTIIENLKKHHLDIIVSIGGDDTLGYAAVLAQRGARVIGIPKTMDGDVNGTEYSIGFPTAVSRSNRFIQELRTPAGSHERILVIELFGRHAGFVAYDVAVSTNADRVLIPESPFDPNELAMQLFQDASQNASNYAVVVVAEGAVPKQGTTSVLDKGVDAFGHTKLGGVGEVVNRAIREARPGDFILDVVYQQLTYIIRCGAPEGDDTKLAALCAAGAQECIDKSYFGKMVGVQNGTLKPIPLDLVKSEKCLDLRLYDEIQHRPVLENILGKPRNLHGYQLRGDE
jgi:6-phosphofructokinase 1